jgi:DNA invertase Pin-like site-specific DNA recombinase
MNTPPPNLAVIYRRVSTDHQDGSLEIQEKRSLDYAAFKGLELDRHAGDHGMFQDPDTSGSTPLLARPGGGAMLRHLCHSGVKHLIVAKLDRLGRNTRDFLNTIETLNELGVVLHIADFGGDSMSTQGHWGKMILTILAAVAEGELGEIRDRTCKRMKQKFDKNELRGKVPYGKDCVYTFADGKTLVSAHALSPKELAGRRVLSKQLRDNPTEQNVIRQMAAWKAAGWSLKKIAAELNLSGYSPKLGGQWQFGNVDSVLRSAYSQQLLQQHNQQYP